MAKPNSRIVDGRRRYIDYCPYCGATDAQVNGAHQDRCNTCHGRYRQYSKLRKQSRDGERLTPRDLEALRVIVSEYRALHAKGFKVPREIPLADN